MAVVMFSVAGGWLVAPHAPRVAAWAQRGLEAINSGLVKPTSRPGEPWIARIAQIEQIGPWVAYLRVHSYVSYT